MKPEPYKNRTVEYFPYFIYSPNGTVEGELVYINRGYKDDIEYLRSLNISLRGKIVLARSIFAQVIYKQCNIYLVTGDKGARVFNSVRDYKS